MHMFCFISCDLLIHSRCVTKQRRALSLVGVLWCYHVVCISTRSKAKRHHVVRMCPLCTQGEQIRLTLSLGRTRQVWPTDITSSLPIIEHHHQLLILVVKVECIIFLFLGIVLLRITGLSIIFKGLMISWTYTISILHTSPFNFFIDY